MSTLSRKKARSGCRAKKTSRDPVSIARPSPIPAGPVGRAVLERVASRAAEWARTNGMKGRIDQETPREENFGIIVVLKDGFGNHARAFFTIDGRESLWEMSQR